MSSPIPDSTMDQACIPYQMPMCEWLYISMHIYPIRIKYKVCRNIVVINRNNN